MFRRLFSIAVWIGVFGIGSGSCLEKQSFKQALNSEERIIL